MSTTATYTIRLARSKDADIIAAMSRDYVEHGHGWRYTAPRILRCIANRSMNVAVAEPAGSGRSAGALLGFAIMEYSDTNAHLTLLAVTPHHRRRGIGTALVQWLEGSAATAGIQWIRLEARAANLAAREMYSDLGYQETGLVRGYYSGRESAVRLAKNLWASADADAAVIAKEIALPGKMGN
jgi:ribosomal protein S18 acetylase RimI-like enzyme